MKNRAKCRLCGSLIESFHRYDFVACKCGEISIDGGKDHLHCAAKDWKNFLRVDDVGNEIIVSVAGEESEVHMQLDSTPLQSKKERIDMLRTMIGNLENLPPEVLLKPVNHYDFYSYLAVVLSILTSEDK